MKQRGAGEGNDQAPRWIGQPGGELLLKLEHQWQKLRRLVQEHYSLGQGQGGFAKLPS